MGKGPIENAEEIIERFGGIRPMARQMDVAVTTVQGWKKRNVIPATRRQEVLEAAQEHDVDLSGLMEDAQIANENVQVPPPEPETETVTEPVTEPDPAPPVSEQPARPSHIPQTRQASSNPEDLQEKLAEIEKRAAKSAYANIAMAVVVIAVLAGFTLWLKPWSMDQAETPADNGKLSALEEDMDRLRGDVDEVKAEQSFLSTMIPEDLNERIASIQEKASKAQESVSSALQSAQENPGRFIDDTAANWEERIKQLEGQVGDLKSISNLNVSGQMAGLLSRFSTLRESVPGQEQLERSVNELGALVASLNDQRAILEETMKETTGQDAASEIRMEETTPSLNSALDAARSQSTALNQTFKDVPTQDLKAAAMLLAMSQMRQSLNRDNAAFDDDLQLLKNLVGEDNPALSQSLDRLAPHARAGVLTPAGLSKEFRTLAGEAVVASLKGEDVTFSEKARAQMNELFQVEKDGELITGTPTQAKLVKAGKHLDEGDLAAAISEVEALEGPAADVAQPWLQKAKTTLMAQKIKEMLAQGIGSVAISGSTDTFLRSDGPAELIQDEETGINILRRSGPR